MGKSITITDKNTGRIYTLEFNRKAIETMERQGFVVSEISDKPMTVLPALFRGAFLMHHPSVRRDVVDALFARLSDRTGLIEKLAEMYNEPILELIGENENDEGNAEWGASF